MLIVKQDYTEVLEAYKLFVCENKKKCCFELCCKTLDEEIELLKEHEDKEYLISIVKKSLQVLNESYIRIN